MTREYASALAKWRDASLRDKKNNRAMAMWNTLTARTHCVARADLEQNGRLSAYLIPSSNGPVPMEICSFSRNVN